MRLSGCTLQQLRTCVAQQRALLSLYIMSNFSSMLCLSSALRLFCAEVITLTNTTICVVYSGGSDTIVTKTGQVPGRSSFRSEKTAVARKDKQIIYLILLLRIFLRQQIKKCRSIFVLLKSFYFVGHLSMNEIWLLISF